MKGSSFIHFFHVVKSANLKLTHTLKSSAILTSAASSIMAASSVVAAAVIASALPPAAEEEEEGEKAATETGIANPRVSLLHLHMTGSETSRNMELMRKTYLSLT